MSTQKLRVLVVEDSKFLAAEIHRRLSVFENLECILVKNYYDAKKLLKQQGSDFFLALLDLCLPDARDGEIVALMDKYDIPSIIFSNNFDRGSLTHYYSMGVIDCIPKASPASLEYFISLVKRLSMNREINVLVVEDSITTRKIICTQLSRQQVTVIEATDGNNALELMEEHPSIHLVLTDYNMPNMDGFDLTRKLREKYSKDELPIIGMSSHSQGEYAVKFLKLGANDFIHKPFSYEELLCRVSQNLDICCLIEELKKNAYVDALTGLNNRRFLWEYGTGLFNNAEYTTDSLTVAMVDIDNFKDINDTYGHHMGDNVLAKVSNNLQKHLVDKDIIARIGGEEFCVILHNKDTNEAKGILDKLRISVAEDSFKFKEKEIKITVSIGMCEHTEDDFETMLKTADKALYTAKDDGRNCLRVA